MIKRLQYQSKKHNKQIEKQVIIMDLQHLSYALHIDAISTFKSILAIDEAYYPERLDHLYMINAPW